MPPAASGLSGRVFRSFAFVPEQLLCNHYFRRNRSSDDARNLGRAGTCGFGPFALSRSPAKSFSASTVSREANRVATRGAAGDVTCDFGSIGAASFAGSLSSATGFAAITTSLGTSRMGTWRIVGETGCD